MVAKSILDIEVNAGEFEQFTRALDKYRETLESLPGTWKKISDAAEDAAEAGAAATVLPHGPGRPSGGGFAPGGGSAAPGVAPTAAQQQAANQATRSRPQSPSGAVPPSYHPTWSWAPNAFTPGVRPGAGGGGGALPPINIPPFPGAGGTPPGGGGGGSGVGAWSSHTVHNVVNITQAGQKQQQQRVQQASWAKRVQQDSLASFQQAYKITRGIWDNVEGTAKTLLKWTGLATIFSGLLGAGGLFGIDRLGAASAAATRSATGIGTSPGNQEAFRINYARLIDPDAVLGNISDMENDPTKRGYLQSLIGANHMHDDTAQMGVLAIRAARERIMRQGINNVSPQWLQANGLDSLGIDLASARRLASSTADLPTAERGYGQDAATLNLDPKTQKAWTFFTQQMTRAGQTIENDFIRGLVDLADPLSNLSKAVVTTINNLMSNPNLKGWIDGLAKGIKEFGDWIQTPGFQASVKTFITDVGQLANVIGSSVTWLLAHLPSWMTGAPANAASLPTTGTGTGQGQQPAGNAGAGGQGVPGTGIVSSLFNLSPLQGGNSTTYDAAKAAVGFEGQGPSGVQAYLKANGIDLNAAQSAWCAAFVNASLKKVGIKGSGSQVATSFENWGHAGDATKAQPGDILVLSRGHSAGQTGGHVGFATGNTRMVKNAQGQMVQQDQMIAGNEGGGAGTVARNWYNASDLMDRQANASDLPGYGSDATTGGHHNPGNLRAAKGYSTVNGFAVFPDDNTGIQAMAKQIGLYVGRGNNTPEGIINTYDSGDNAAKRKAYLAAVLKDTGMTAQGQISAGNEGQIDRLISAMLKQENSIRLSPAGVHKIVIQNNTGGNAVVGANQAAAGS